MTRPGLDRFIDDLKEIVGAVHVVTDPEELVFASLDETPALKPSMPDYLVRPKTTDEVRKIMHACNEFHIPVTPRGAGTGKSGGCVPLNGGLVIDFSRMNQILGIDSANLTARVQPGVILGDFRAAVDEHKLFYPPDPASMKWCSLGGNVNENAGGPSALKYGNTRDYVLGLEICTTQGEIMRVGKRTHKGVVGYDLVSLLVGSEGTLALVTEITLKLLPKPRSVQTAMLSFASSKQAAGAATEILRAGILPRGIEYMDKRSIHAARSAGLPYRFAQDAEAALIVEVDGDHDDDTLRTLMRAVELSVELGAVDTMIANGETQRREIWDTRRGLSEAVRKLRKKKVSEDVVVPRDKIPEMVARIDELGEKYGFFTCAFGHAGDGNLHAQILYDGDQEMPRVEKLLEELFAVTLSLGGTISGEHGIGVSKQPYLAMEQSQELIELQRRVKNAFDPTGILNPGKFLPYNH